MLLLLFVIQLVLSPEKDKRMQCKFYKYIVLVWPSFQIISDYPLPTKMTAITEDYNHKYHKILSMQCNKHIIYIVHVILPAGIGRV
jgi:hypothetical protein